MDAKEYSQRIINRYHNVTDYINDCTDKRIPITEKTDDEREDLSRLFLALAGNPMSKDGSWKHGQPLIYELMESYHQAKLKDDLPTEEEIEGELFNELKLESFGGLEERNAWINPQSVKAAAKAITNLLKGER